MMSAEQHRARAKLLRDKFPESRAAVLHDLAAKAMDARRPLGAEATEYLRRLEEPTKQAADAEWNEQDHPRRKDGKFGSGGAGSSPATEAPKAAGEPEGGTKERYGGQYETGGTPAENHQKTVLKVLSKPPQIGIHYRRMLNQLLKEGPDFGMTRGIESELKDKLLDAWNGTLAKLVKNGQGDEAQRVAKKVGELETEKQKRILEAEKKKPPEQKPPEQKKDTLNSLGKEYRDFMQDIGRSDLGSADEAMYDPDLTADQRGWLQDFKNRWDKAWAEETRPPEQTIQDRIKKALEERKHRFPGRKEKMVKWNSDIAEREGYPADKITMNDGVKFFMLDGKQHNYAGLARLGTGEIEMFTDQCDMLPEKTYKGMVVHEVMHQKFEAYASKLFKTGGSLFRADAPLSLADQRELKITDGVTPYSRQWWKEQEAGKAETKIAYHETLAEMARVKFETGKLPGSAAWQALYLDVQRHWDKQNPPRQE